MNLCELVSDLVLKKTRVTPTTTKGFSLESLLPLLYKLYKMTFSELTYHRANLKSNLGRGCAVLIGQDWQCTMSVSYTHMVTCSPMAVDSEGN